MAIKIDDKLKTPLILIGIAVAAYLGYRWWSNRQQGTNSPTGALGTNLNSVAPELIGGSAGPDSGITYSPPSPVITVNEGPVPGEDEKEPQHGPVKRKPPPKHKLHGTPVKAPPGFHPPGFGFHPKPKPKPKLTRKPVDK